MKFELDKYYTPIEEAKRLIDKTFEIIGKENISEVIEPAAGAGAFSSQIDGCIAYDIKPEGENIIQADFLKLDIEYKKDRLIIGNPPFGKQTYKHFLNKALKIADYVAFIMPVTMIGMAEYDGMKEAGLILYEERLDDYLFKNKIKTIFIIVKRGKYTRPKPVKIDGIDIEKDKSKYTENNIYICAWGTSSCRMTTELFYASNIIIHIDNQELREFIIKNWNREEYFKYFPCCKTPNTSIYKVSKYVKNLYEQWTDERFYKHFNISKEGQEEIEEILKEYT